jgi:hypothetical protein
MIEIYFEYDEEYNKYDHPWNIIMDRDNISKFDYFDKKGFYYFDFMDFIDDILDKIFNSYDPYIDLDKG